MRMYDVVVRRAFVDAVYVAMREIDEVLEGGEGDAVAA